MAKKKLQKKISNTTLTPWKQSLGKSVFPLQKGSQAGIVVNPEGKPLFFIFDTSAFLDILSEIDEKLADRLSSDDYHSKESNPAGWLIDEIEATLPLKTEYVDSLKEAVKEAEKKGWIPTAGNTSF